MSDRLPDFIISDGEDDGDGDGDGDDDDNVILFQELYEPMELDLEFQVVDSDLDSTPPARVSRFTLPVSPPAIRDEEEKVCCEKKIADEETSLRDEKGCSQENEIDGLFCPICMEAWTNGGDHQVCCLPCGHIYGLSCIQKWIQQSQSSKKCPQCKKRCRLKDIRLLYASRIVAVDEELRKKVQTLEAKCASLEMKRSECCKREAELHMQVHRLKERASSLEGMLEYSERILSGSITASSGFLGRSPGRKFDSEFMKSNKSCNFVLQKEFDIEGARIFDVDAVGQTVVIARRLAGMGALNALTKIGLIAPHDRQDIQLPVSTKAVKDLRVSPHGRLTMVASLGKKLSIFSSESNSTILNYDLPAAAWSCSWDVSCLHHTYAGLQNGMLLVFDMRQTRGPVESLVGLTCNPVHSIYSVSPKSALSSVNKTVITASSVGICEWNVGGVDKRPFLVPESENHGVCISLACSPKDNEIVASYRPKVKTTDEAIASQAFRSTATCPMGNFVLGTHVSYKRLSSRCYEQLGYTSANVNDIRLPKSAIADICDNTALFVSGDEVRCEVTMQALPSLVTVQNLKLPKFPLRDVKFTHVSNSSMLGCLCDVTLQLYSPKLL